MNCTRTTGYSAPRTRTKQGPHTISSQSRSSCSRLSLAAGSGTPSDSVSLRPIECGRSTCESVYLSKACPSAPFLLPVWASSKRRWRLSRYTTSRRSRVLVQRLSSGPWSATRASEYLRLGSLLRLKTTMHAEGGVAKDWPGPGAIGCIDEGICRDMFGRSIDSSGAGMLPAVCCKQRSTLMLTPPCLPVQSRDERPLRSEPE
mmetsp:Transcript_2122/g.5540  ORF Transcript_2122/g.5540 Transcript_2122/m.5540 type:complete len:203 (+) Transcript_2122:266-874(+)